MKKIRAVFRLILLAIVTLSLYLVYVIGLFFTWIFRIRFEIWRNPVLTLWAQCVKVILRMEIRVVGQPPTPPFFLVSNHLSYIDIIPLYRYLKCSFITQKGVGSWPVIGLMAKSMGLIFIDRSKRMDVGRVNKLISGYLHDHQGIILFPEGTTSDGNELLPFRPSLLQHPAESDLPVYYCSITYRTTADDLPPSESVCWWGGTPFSSHFFKLAGNKKIYCTLTFGSQTVHETDRKKLAEILHKKVSKQFEPVSRLPEEKEPGTGLPDRL